ncbi:hypothetical protein A946_06180 [Methylacidiphilum kamchatkense Kam1]|uniref:Uncharacterized protein n=1 Tax=Methylacidiphilum kamchatkense Kam1 TaxID=1202785 RepID=A0ABR4ZWC3_9BACT|nr:hypothetical protein A946_06180 [Methylacidiphilum kamchatkense Kam1]
MALLYKVRSFGLNSSTTSQQMMLVTQHEPASGSSNFLRHHRKPCRGRGCFLSPQALRANGGKIYKLEFLFASFSKHPAKLSIALQLFFPFFYFSLFLM